MDFLRLSKAPDVCRTVGRKDAWASFNKALSLSASALAAEGGAASHRARVVVAAATQQLLLSY